MPELPEVHTIVSDLNDNVVGYKIVKAWVSDKYPKIHDKEGFIAGVTGKTVVGVRRIAKNILVELSDKNYLLFHLAMTGQIFLLEPEQKHGKRAHVVFQIRKNKTNKILTFADTRMFGKVEILTPTQKTILEQRYGVEPVAKDFDVVALYEKLKNRKAIIKNILMDQSIIAGLGNIYATEALFLAKIHPQTQLRNVSSDRFANAMEAAKIVLKQGIKNRGSTLPDETYVDIFGKQGSQQKYFNIYGKKSCPVCNTTASFIKIGGRGTYFCPNCQQL